LLDSGQSFSLIAKAKLKTEKKEKQFVCVRNSNTLHCLILAKPHGQR